jgi:hypothetical protein
MKYFLYIFLFFTVETWAQPVTVLIHSRAAYLTERFQIKTVVPTLIHPEVKGYSIRDIGEYTDLLRSKSDTANFSQSTLRDLQYLSDEVNEWSKMAQPRKRPLLWYFYKTPAYLFEINKFSEKDPAKPIFLLRINPVLNVKAGTDTQDTTGALFVNQRGVELRAEIDRKVFIYTSVLESQAHFPSYVNGWSEKFFTVPGAGSYKTYNSSIINVQKGRDFNVATAYVGFQATKHIGIQFGHGRQFLGNGYRSVFLSDFAPPAFFFKINTRIWKFHYQNLFMELSPRTANQDGQANRLPKKYMAIHYLNYNLTKNMSFGLFEATAFNRSQQFEFQYLNPVILYRSVEAVIGSPDNVIIGLDGRWNLWHHLQLYGQLTVDEFILKELRAGTGWWGNKYAVQAGIKYIDVLGVDHLDIQLEYNMARPYTWSHFDSLNSFSHFNHPLAHPLGANFREFVGVVRWQPLRALFITGRIVQMHTGDDPFGKNYGSNILLSYINRASDYDNFIGQGVSANTRLLGLDVSWELWRNTFMDFHVLLRNKKSDDKAFDLDNRIFTMGVRMNFWPVNNDF